MHYEPLRLVDLSPIEVPVTIDDKEYVLREASEGASVEYRNLLMASTKFGADMKPTGMDGMVNGEPLLVSRCLFEKVVLNKGSVEEKVVTRPVPLETVKAWPHRIVKPIFALAKKISLIDDGGEETEEGLTKQIEALQVRLVAVKASKEEDDAAKNSSRATAVTSA